MRIMNNIIKCANETFSKKFLKIDNTKLIDSFDYNIYPKIDYSKLIQVDKFYNHKICIYIMDTCKDSKLCKKYKMCKFIIK